MILRSSPPSPFGRKVKIVAMHLGVYGQLTVETADPGDPNDSIRVQNPLGKIPALVLGTGAVLYDSRVIIEYLDHIADKTCSVYPHDTQARFEALRLQALADGMMDAAILQVYEGRFRPAGTRDANWVSYQGEKVTRSLNAVNAAPPPLDAAVHVGHIALACALGYLDLRFDGAWRGSYPALVTWLDGFADKVPAFAATAFEG